MKYLKTYENIKPKVGDFIVARLSEYEELDDFLLNNIGTITKIFDKGKSYDVLYYDIPMEYRMFFNFTSDITKDDEIINGTIELFKDDIISFSKNKNDLQHYIDANKFNL